jgi:ribosomal protein L7Ae-like RNA K-turn-binding protein
VLDLIGLSARAGAVISGTQAVRAAVREGGVCQVILAADAAEAQLGKLIPLLDARRIPYYRGFSQEELGAALGRAPVSAIGISNPQLGERIRALTAGLGAAQGHQGGK